ncbi:MAG: hypothetical protein IJ259_04050 [Oscillospiraceae bacterium]|nr:hypothetical protein [Oscillospiraceae bacterium]
MDRKTAKAALAVNLLIVLMEIAGICMGFSNGAKMLVYYTVLSNLFALAACACFVLWAAGVLRAGDREPKPWITTLRYLSTGCLTLTFLVVVLVFVPMALPYGGVDALLFKGVNLFHHLLCPVFSFVSFCFLEKGAPRSRRQNVLALIPTVIYAVVLVILNLMRVVRGPYPFLLVYEQPLWASVLWAVVILGAAYGVYFGLRKLQGRKSREAAVSGAGRQ